jgi:hypothetical protein
MVAYDKYLTLTIKQLNKITIKKWCKSVNNKQIQVLVGRKSDLTFN